MRLKQDELHLFQTQNQNTDEFFFPEERTSKKGTDPLFWNRYEVQKILIQFFCKLQMLRHAQMQNVKTAKCFKNRQSHFLQMQTVHKSSFQ